MNAKGHRDMLDFFEASISLRRLGRDPLAFIDHSKREPLVS